MTRLSKGYSANYVAPSGELRRALALAEETARQTWSTIDRQIGPGASGLEILAASGFRFDINENLPPWFHGWCSASRPVVIIARGYNERATGFSGLHEQGHHTFDRLFPRGELLERACQRYAAATLMPPHAFLRAVRALGLSPVALQRAFPHASLEALATRLADLLPNVVVCSWDWMARKWIRASDDLDVRPEHLQAMEETIARVYVSPMPKLHVTGEGFELLALRTRDFPKFGLTVMRIT
jgi:hypothetical protein